MCQGIGSVSFQRRTCGCHAVGRLGEARRQYKGLCSLNGTITLTGCYSTRISGRLVCLVAHHRCARLGHHSCRSLVSVLDRGVLSTSACTVSSPNSCLSTTNGPGFLTSSTRNDNANENALAHDWMAGRRSVGDARAVAGYRSPRCHRMSVSALKRHI